MLTAVSMMQPFLREFGDEESAMTRGHDDREDDLKPAQESECNSESERDGDSAADVGARLRLPSGFAQSLMPSMDVAVAKMLAPVRE